MHSPRASSLLGLRGNQVSPGAPKDIPSTTTACSCLVHYLPFFFFWVMTFPAQDYLSNSRVLSSLHFPDTQLNFWFSGMLRIYFHHYCFMVSSMEILKGGKEVLTLRLSPEQHSLTLLKNCRHTSPVLIFKFLNT